MSEFDSEMQPKAGAFYRCDDAEHCGMRFPVTPTDHFRGCCPRCGSTVQIVARIEDDDLHISPPDPAWIAPSNLHLFLDNWRSLFNVGAAFRTADGAGVRHLHLCGITATPDIQQKLAKTALGAEKAVAWSYYPDAVKAAAKLQQDGAQLWVLERGAGVQSLFDINFLPHNTPIILAAGNEVIGGDPGLAARADRMIQLPMLGSKGSLNVAVALSITTYWLRALELGKPPEEVIRAVQDSGKIWGRPNE